MGGCDDGLEPTQLQGQVHFTFIHTSDIHSRLFPYNLLIGQADAGLGLGSVNTIANVGGLARVSHIVGRERARSGRSLHIDGGDCFQGAPVFNFYLGEAEIRGLSAMGADAMLIANHEFDAGARNLGQHRVEAMAAASTFDRVAPHQHGLHAPELRLDLVGEVVVPDRGLGRDAGASHRLEQRHEAARGRVGTVAGGALAGIQQRDPRYRCGGHGLVEAVLSTHGHPAASQPSMPPRR